MWDCIKHRTWKHCFVVTGVLHFLTVCLHTMTAGMLHSAMRRRLIEPTCTCVRQFARSTANQSWSVTRSVCHNNFYDVICRVTTCLENLEMSGNLTAVRKMSGILLKVRELSGKNLVREKLPKTVYCKLHICIHTGI